MIPAVAIPTAQVPPPVDPSAFTGQMSDPAVGRLPFNTVAPPVTGQKVADDSRGSQQQARRGPSEDAPENLLSRLTGRAEGEIRLESPFSAPFMAQLFGQINLDTDVVGGLFGDGTGVAAGFVDFERLAEFGEVKYMPSGAFEPREVPALQQALQVNATQTLEATLEASIAAVNVEAGASVPADIALADELSLQAETGVVSTAAPAQEARQAVTTASAAPPARVEPTPFFSNGVGAYVSTQSRNDSQAAVTSASSDGAQGISLFL